MGNNAKVKLKEKREERGLTQKDMAKRLNMEVSGYCKRENGQLNTQLNFWAECAKILTCPIEDIYEEDENKQSLTFKDNATGNYGVNNINTIQITVSEAFIEKHLKNIIKLEKEISELKELLMKK